MIKLFIALLLTGLVVGGGCGYSIFETGKNILNNQLNTGHWTLSAFKWCTNGLPFVGKLESILDDKNYIVLLQNNMEIRPAGGFAGSYAVFRTHASGLKAIDIQDIYVPDGQLVGHVDPPLPIQQAFGQGWWKLRDANWDIDFATAAAQTAWFFAQGHESAEGIVAINLSLVQKLLEILGPIKPTDYPEVTASNFYQLAQRHAEENFFPGSTQKRDFLGAVGREVIEQIKDPKPVQAAKILKVVFDNLENQNILVWVKDESIQKELEFRGWAGRLGENPGNYLYIVDTNLGANKANCCVKRSVSQRVSESDSQIEITWRNDNPFTNPRPPVFWGGDYINWVRVVVPIEAEINSVIVGNRELENDKLIWQYGLQENIYEVEERGDFKIVGFWAKIPAQQSAIAIINYQGSMINKPMLIKRQPGIESFDYRLVINGETKYEGKISQDTVIN